MLREYKGRELTTSGSTIRATTVNGIQLRRTSRSRGTNGRAAFYQCFDT